MNTPYCVIDADSVLCWCFEDEASDAADALLVSLAAAGAAVPALWHLQVAQLLLSAGRQQLMTEARAAGFMALLDTLPIETDAASADRARREVLHVARETGLAMFDAAYLELAMRRRIPLATRDSGLRQAAHAVGVATLDL
jgi:predicted nucleic acid-binding protein